ncbi:membrane protein DedA with SNARE-associated domain [Palleronia aestuarii]|uniref:Membrane protein DedA with SNARE-associated domain n=1 Tax=Palleronia aestuarii TaxID=568105 RepID=A0A2W7PU39_9RHOB|nr:DedA family protein [Palleronia aestuarii]PZX12989.1 membrane protein DedA with SNARE-associated domain [Palleronia aestuarii]
MQAAVNDWLPSFQSLGLWGYWAIGLLAMLEAVAVTSLFAPGSVIVVLGGVLVSHGLYDFGDMILVVAIGTILGAEISYVIGARASRLSRPEGRVLSEANLARARRMFDRFGPLSVLVGHFVGPLRPVIPVVAGLSQMSRKRFVFLKAIGGFTYAVIFLGIGTLLGHSIDVFSWIDWRWDVIAATDLLTFCAVMAILSARRRRPRDRIDPPDA